MKKELKAKIALNRHMGCFGEFNLADPVCKKLCVLSIRCAIEQDQNARLEILEELVASEDLFTRIQ